MGVVAEKSPLFELLISAEVGTRYCLQNGVAGSCDWEWADGHGTESMCFLQNPERQALGPSDSAQASARPGAPAPRLGSEPPRRSWCEGPEAGRTCGAR